MKRIVLIALLINIIFAKQYSIVVLSSKKFNKKTAEKFIQRFHNGVIKQYSKYIEYKIEPFESYKAAKKYLKKVKRYYKHSFIINYNPNLGKIIYINNKKSTDKTTKIIVCKNNQKCENNYKTNEYNLTQIKKNLTVSVPIYISDLNNTNIEQNNTNYQNQCFLNPYQNLMFYIDLYANIYDGQKHETTSLKGNNENVKLGLIYEKNFLNQWHFYSDLRLIYSRKDRNNITNNFFFDVNEFYINSFCLTKYFDVLIGRKKTKDYKSWWYDSYLDQIRLFSTNSLLSSQLILATRIDNSLITNENSNKINIKNFVYLILHSDYEYYFNRHIGLILMYENKKHNNVNLVKEKNEFLGIYTNAKKDKFKYWANFAISKNIDQKQNGFGLDIGVMYYNLDKFYGIGYGLGSKNFRQPYIATNYSDYFIKNFNIKYYGELLDPFLENIQILSLYGGINIDEYKNIILSIHNYRQLQNKSNNYNNTYLFNTNGNNKNIGNEMDIIYQYLLAKKRKLKVGFSYFMGGSAYKLFKKNALRLYINYRYYWK